MILSFNPSVFTSEEDDFSHQLFKLILSFFDNAFLWDIDNIDALFISQDGEFQFETPFTKMYFTEKLLGSFEIKIGEAFAMATYNTSLHNKYLTRIIVGTAEGEVHPKEAFKIVNYEAILIVENGANDGNFIHGLAKNYSMFSERKSIYQLVEDAFKKVRIICSNGGGVGGLPAQIDSHLKKYRAIASYKFFVLFDSDRSASTEINRKHRKLLEVLKNRKFDIDDATEWVFQKGDLYLWHMLYKREMENYVPLPILFEQYSEIPVAQKKVIEGFSKEQEDFFKFGPILSGEYKTDIPLLFSKEGIAEQLEEKCKHHFVKIELPNDTLKDVTEIEKILLMIARII